MQAKTRRGARCDQNPRCTGEGLGFAGPRRVLANSPTPRMAAFEEVARVALFLVSDDSSYVSGIGLAVDGAKVGGVFDADRYRTDFRLIE